MQYSWYALYVIPHTLSLGTALSQAVGQPRLSCSQDGVVKVCSGGMQRMKYECVSLGMQWFAVHLVYDAVDL